MLPAFTDFGGHPLIYVTVGGDVLCAACATRSVDSPDGDTDPVRAADVHWEGPDEICAGCNTPIPSAYGDPDEN